MLCLITLPVVTGMAQEPPPPASQRPALMQKYDKDGDGRLSPAEINAAYHPAGKKNHDAGTHRKQTRQAPASNDAQIQALLEQYDRDHNGTLDYEEMAALRNAMKKNPPAPSTPPAGKQP